MALEIVVRFTDNTTPRCVSTFDEEEHAIEIIQVTDAIRHRQMLAQFECPLDFIPVLVKKIFPCDGCGAPVVLARLGRETKLLDCWENPYSPRYWCRWETDPILSVHYCGGLQ